MSPEEKEEIIYNLKKSSKRLTELIQDISETESLTRIQSYVKKDSVAILEYFSEGIHQCKLKNPQSAIFNILPQTWKEYLGFKIPSEEFKSTWMLIWQGETEQKFNDKVKLLETEKLKLEQNKFNSMVNKSFQARTEEPKFLNYKNPEDQLKKDLTMKDDPELTIQYILNQAFKNNARLSSSHPENGFVLLPGTNFNTIKDFLHPSVLENYNSLLALRSISSSIIDKRKHPHFDKSILKNKWFGPYWNNNQGIFEIIQMNTGIINTREGWSLIFHKNQIFLGERKGRKWIGMFRSVKKNSAYDINYHDGAVGYNIRDYKF